MTDVRRARREAEKAAREALNGTLVDSAGELGVALAGRLEAVESVAAARAKAQALIDAAHAEGAALVTAAEAEAGKADEAYVAAWHAGKDAGWTPAQLRSMGYAKPPTTRRHTLTVAAAASAGEPSQARSVDGEHVVNVA